MRVRFVCVPDEESEDVDDRSTDELVARAACAATSRSPASRPTCTSASRPRACWRCASRSRGRAAHGSTPWLGDNAVLKAIDVFRRIEALPFARESSELFDRPSINLGRIDGRRRVNKVPDACVMDVDIRYLPGQDPGAILAQIRAMPDVEVVRRSRARRRTSSRTQPVRARAARARSRARPRARR